MRFDYENRGSATFYTCTLDEGESIDELGLGMLANNRVGDCLKAVFSQEDDVRTLRYNVSSRVPLQRILEVGMNRERVLNVLEGISDTFTVLDGYMLDPKKIVLDKEKIFCSVSDAKPQLLYLPIVEFSEEKSFNEFAREVFKAITYDMSEDTDYAAFLMNFFNGSAEITPSELKEAVGAARNRFSGFAGFQAAGSAQPGPFGAAGGAQPQPFGAQSGQGAGMQQPAGTAAPWQAGAAGGFQAQGRMPAPEASTMDPAANAGVMGRMAQGGGLGAGAAANADGKAAGNPLDSGAQEKPKKGLFGGKKKGNDGAKKEAGKKKRGLFSRKGKDETPDGTAGRAAQGGLPWEAPQAGGMGGYAANGAAAARNGFTGNAAASGMRGYAGNGVAAAPTNGFQSNAAASGMGSYAGNGAAMPGNGSGSNAAANGRGGYVGNGAAASGNGLWNAAEARNSGVSSGNVFGNNSAANGGSGQGGIVGGNGGMQGGSPAPNGGIVEGSGVNGRAALGDSRLNGSGPAGFAQTSGSGANAKSGAFSGAEPENMAFSENEATVFIRPESYETGEPQVRQARASVVRVKTGEEAEVTKDVFRIGKQRNYVDMYVGGNSFISRSQADILRKGGEYFIRDNNSLNHTYVNGEIIQSGKEVRLRGGDTIVMGDEEFTFKLR